MVNHLLEYTNTNSNQAVVWHNYPTFIVDTYNRRLTPLEATVHGGRPINTSIIILLLRHGAKLELCQNINLFIVDLIRAYAPNNYSYIANWANTLFHELCNRQNRCSGRTALHSAIRPEITASETTVQVVAVLLSIGADPNLRDNFNVQPANYAAWNAVRSEQTGNSPSNALFILRLLLGAGAVITPNDFPCEPDEPLLASPEEIQSVIDRASLQKINLSARELKKRLRGWLKGGMGFDKLCRVCNLNP